MAHLEQPSDSRIQFGGSPMEDGQTYTTTFEDQRRTPVTPPPPPPPPTPPPAETVRVEDFNRVQEEVAHLRSSFDRLADLITQQLSNQAQQGDRVQHTPVPPTRVQGEHSHVRSSQHTPVPPTRVPDELPHAHG